MNLSPSTRTPPLPRRVINALLLGAVALGVSHLAMADEAVQQPSAATYQVAVQSRLLPDPHRGEAGDRVDWNVDYPSQLAPQPVDVANDAPVNKLASTVATSSDQPL
ncbi:hypothetical protein [Dyella jiangningensis]|uniref:Uncharacterized protein n=1 Tax=Dyella jiangningensis TaxID=1379159 RepID=A0A328PBH2_9GAMM|nr:hypothetical protein [Dyella jiangningensis]RAO77636.1 hypothetical protein CA260_07155 [Dyella jiangningensis]